MEVCSCFRRERERQSKSTIFFKIVRILKLVKICESQEFLKFLKIEYSVYAENVFCKLFLKTHGRNYRYYGVPSQVSVSLFIAVLL